MHIAVIGTGEVGSTLGGKLKSLGHDVVFGSRSPGSGKAKELTETTGAPVKSHKEAVAEAELIVNATHGEHSVKTLTGTALDGKLLVDIGNYESAVEGPIETPLAEALQAAFPKAKVVKTLNNVSANLMTNPESLGAPTSVFVAGNDAKAKATVETLLRAFGWTSIVDLGDLKSARAMEELVPLWMRLYEKFQSTNFNLHLVRPS